MQASRGIRLRRKPQALKMALEGREPQAQVVMVRPAGADDAQEARSRQVGSVRQGTASAGSHEQVGRGRSFRRKPEVITFDLTSRE
jgi:hypothetical protein